jgi:hypothetical protein
MQTRRDVIRSLAAGAAVAYPIAVSSAPVRSIELCRMRAGELADAMSAIEGGQWRVSIDEKMEFILISRVL